MSSVATSSPKPLPPPRQLTFGVEIELVIQGSKDLDLEPRRRLPGDAVAKAIADAGIPGITVIASSEGHQADDPAGLWRITFDGSIKPVDKHPLDTFKDRESAFLQGGAWLGTELVSPVFTLADITELLLLIEQILGAVREAFNTVTTTDSTGLHVHLGVGRGPDDRFTVDEVRHICLLYLAYEDKINGVHASHRTAEDHPYCRSNRNAIETLGHGDTDAIIHIFDQTLTMEGLAALMCPDGSGGIDRNFKLNLEGLKDGGNHTIEWRQAEGTTDPHKVFYWVSFLIGFVCKAMGNSDTTVKETLIEPLPLTAVPELQDLWNHLVLLASSKSLNQE